LVKKEIPSFWYIINKIRLLIPIMFTQVIIIAGQEAHAVPVKKLPKGEVYMNQYVFLDTLPSAQVPRTSKITTVNV